MLSKPPWIFCYRDPPRSGSTSEFRGGSRESKRTFPPPGVSKLEPVKWTDVSSFATRAPMPAGRLCVLSLRAQRLPSTVAMYDFTAPHIVQNLQGVFAKKGTLELVLDPREALSNGRGGGTNPKAPR